MSIATVILELMDNGGRRLNVDRSNSSYSNHVPNRRTSKDRRSGSERRGGKDRREDKVIFKKIQRLENDLREGIDR